MVELTLVGVRANCPPTYQRETPHSFWSTEGESKGHTHLVNTPQQSRQQENCCESARMGRHKTSKIDSRGTPRSKS